MVNIEMFRHPKYYKELRKLRNKEARVNDHSASISDQVISANKLDGDMKVRAPGPGLQATSPKQQASSTKLLKQQATSIKPQAQRLKLQATSFKRQDS
jgi:hypothetical protein